MRCLLLQSTLNPVHPMMKAEGPGILPNPPLMALPLFCYVSGVSQCFVVSWSRTEEGCSVWLGATSSVREIVLCLLGVKLKSWEKFRGFPLAHGDNAVCSLEWLTFGLECPPPMGADSVEGPA